MTADPNTREASNAALEQAADESRKLDGSSCPTRPTTPCDVAEWVYETVSVHPRMYGRCVRCETRYIVYLPRRRFEADAAWFTEQGKLDHIVIDSAETALRQSGTSQRLWWLLSENPTAITLTVLYQIRKDLTESARAWETRIGEFVDMLLLRINHYEDAAYKVSRKALRGSAIKAREAVIALRQQARDARPAIKQAQEELRAVQRQIANARAESHREPLPMPEGYTPPAINAVVLCDELRPPELIYALVDPADPELVRYVGKTVDPTSRYYSHCTMGTEAVFGWAEKVRASGRKPTMVLLERCDAETVSAREAHWIHHYRDRHQADLNRSIPRRV